MFTVSVNHATLVSCEVGDTSTCLLKNCVSDMNKSLLVFGQESGVIATRTFDVIVIVMYFETKFVKLLQVQLS